MNERIKELALQADIHFSAHHQHHGVDTAVIIPTDLEAFAEMIVKECAAMAKGFEFAIGRDGLSNAMKEHFGVE